jgi:hypothetical protein
MSMVMCRSSLVELLVLALRPVHAETGIAAFYGGGRTASGEVSGPNGLTAAHRTLPFGTKVLETFATVGPSSFASTIAGHMAAVVSSTRAVRPRARSGSARRGLASCVSDARPFAVGLAAAFGQTGLLLLFLVRAGTLALAFKFEIIVCRSERSG